MANIFPDECAELYELAKTGRLEKAVKLQMALLEANQAVTGRFGIPGLKAAMDMIGGIGGSPRRPLLPLGDEDKKILEDIIARTRDAAAHIRFDRKGGC